VPDKLGCGPGGAARVAGGARGHLQQARCGELRQVQPEPDSGIGFQVKDLNIFQVVPSSLGSGTLGSIQGYLAQGYPP